MTSGWIAIAPPLACANITLHSPLNTSYLITMKRIVSAMLILATASCGSGDSDSGGAVVTPTPTLTPIPAPTPTPSPTPTPTANTNLLELRSDQTFVTIAAALQYLYDTNGQNIRNTKSIAPADGTLLRYAASDGSYTYRIENGFIIAQSEDVAFAANSTAACDENNSVTCYGAAFTFQRSNAATWGLHRFTPSQAANPPSLRYLTFGSVDRAAADRFTGRQQYDARYFAYGFPTAVAGVPSGGSASYSGPLIGRATGDSPASFPRDFEGAQYKLTGTFILEVNFGANTARLLVVFQGTQFDCRVTCGAPITLQFEAQGNLSGGAASFQLPGGSAGFLLGGPAAEEAGGSFVFSANDPSDTRRALTVAGSAAGKR
ncbi:hypothetical protein LQ953_04555 [Sphingomonas sp. IC-56]|nr:hypothetical protein [Sphingomonas sp. IC-56]